MPRTRAAGRRATAPTTAYVDESDSAASANATVVPGVRQRAQQDEYSEAENTTDQEIAVATRRSPRKRSAAPPVTSSPRKRRAAAAAATIAERPDPIATQAAVVFKPSKTARKSVRSAAAPAPRQAPSTAKAGVDKERRTSKDASQLFRDLLAGESETESQDGAALSATSASENEQQDSKGNNVQDAQESQYETAPLQADAYALHSETSWRKYDDDDVLEEGDTTIYRAVSPPASRSLANSIYGRRSLANASQRKEAWRAAELDHDDAIISAVTPLVNRVVDIIMRLFEHPEDHLSPEEHNTLIDYMTGNVGDAEVEDPDSDRIMDILPIKLLESLQLAVTDANWLFVTDCLETTFTLWLYAHYRNARDVEQATSFALECFATSLVPDEMQLNEDILRLHRDLRIHLILARAQTEGAMPPEDIAEAYAKDDVLKRRYVVTGLKALWRTSEAQTKKEVDAILEFDEDLEVLYERYPVEDLTFNFTKHAARLLQTLRLIQASLQNGRRNAVTGSSPSAYIINTARDQVKQADQNRRKSAPGPLATGLSAHASSPVFAKMRESLGKVRLGRSSSLVAPTADGVTRNGGRGIAAPVLMTVDHASSDRRSGESIMESEDDEGLDLEIQASLMPKSSAQPSGSKHSLNAVEDLFTGTANEEEAAESLEETQSQVYRRNLVASSSKAPFLETQGETQDTQWQAEPLYGDEPLFDLANDGFGPGDGYGSDPMDADNANKDDDALPVRAIVPSVNQGVSQVASERLEDANDSDADLPEIPVQSRSGDGEEQPPSGRVEQRTAGDARRVASSRKVATHGNGKEAFKWTDKQAGAERIDMSSPIANQSVAEVSRESPAPSARGNKSSTAKRSGLPTTVRTVSGKSSLATAAQKTGKDKGGNRVIPAVSDSEDSESGIPPSSRKGKRSALGTASGHGAQNSSAFVSSSSEKSDNDLLNSVDDAPKVASRRMAKEKAQAVDAKGKGRSSKATAALADPEQRNARLTLPTHRGNKKKSKAPRSHSTSESESEEPHGRRQASTASAKEGSPDHSVDSQSDAVPVASTSRSQKARPTLQAANAPSTSDNEVDELQQSDNSSDAASTSSESASPKTGKKKKKKSSQVERAPDPPKRTAKTVKPRPPRGKPGASGTQELLALYPSDDEAGELEDYENDPDQLRRKRKLFHKAAKIWKEDLEQTEEFAEIRRKYNAIELEYPSGRNIEPKLRTAWSPDENHTLLVALDLLWNPLIGSTRISDILRDHGKVGLVTKVMRNRTNEQVKNKLKGITKSIKAGKRPKLAFAEETLERDGNTYRAHHA